MLEQSVGTVWHWGGFLALVFAMLAIDLGIFHRKAHVVSLKEAAIWSTVWIALAGVFNVAIFQWFGPDRALEFTTGYLIEKALAVDNIFVFVVIFSAFAIPPIYQHRVLFWGIVGALIMRAAFIFAGSALLQRFHWTIYLFGAILLVTGVKLLFQRSQTMHPERSWVVRAFQKIMPLEPKLHGENFTIRKDGRLFATPLLLALIAVEVTDLIFAVDSIPAIFAVTQDPFIVFTSNIFAILGLRSLYFLLAGIVDKFHYLKVGLSFVLIFVGAKMALIDVYKVPIVLSLGLIALMLTLSIVASLVWPKKGPPTVASQSS